MSTMKWILASALVIATGAILQGCTTPEQSAQQWRARAKASAPWELCHRQIVGGYSAVYGQAVADEIRSQRIDCRDHIAMVQAKMQADAAAQQQSLQQTEIALKLLNQSRPPPPTAQPLPQPLNCYSTVQGNIIRTNCN